MQLVTPLAQVPAGFPFQAVLAERVRFALPLHVVGAIWSASAERNDVIDNPARAGSAILSGGWTSVVTTKFADLGWIARESSKRKAEQAEEYQ